MHLDQSNQYLSVLLLMVRTCHQWRRLSFWRSCNQGRRRGGGRVEDITKFKKTFPNVFPKKGGVTTEKVGGFGSC